MNILRPVLFISFLLLLFLIGIPRAQAEDGYRLWLRYEKLKDKALRDSYRSEISSIVAKGGTQTDSVLVRELQRGLQGMLDRSIPMADKMGDGALIVGTPESSPWVAGLKWDRELSALGPEGYLLRSTLVENHQVTVIASQSPIGCLYGAFHLLRLIGTHQALSQLDLSGKPHIHRRILDHWDNLDGRIERGYAGKSLWKWDELPGRVDSRVTDYARACASIGLNGTVLNNVNADPRILNLPYLEKVAALARALRPYGIRVYLSANFGAPKAIGGLPTADPLDPAVETWWKAKVEEIYGLIPDFGGFLVKANSEGQPGPQDYHRTHAEGANLLARVLAPHGGVVMWRAFVYDDKVDADRIKRAYKEFKPLDGLFDPNVFVQVKNGPLDFQPREPFSPLFGAMPKTPLAAEVEVTQEYLGQSTHLVYLAPLWKEFLDSETYAKGPGSTVEKIVDGTLEKHRDSAIAGVANTGDGRDWCGHPFAAANWYAFGRLAWDPSLEAQAIAEEWTRLTWGNDPEVVSAICSLMMDSRQAFVDYAAPLGLNGVFEKDIHYAPDPGMVDPRRADWSAAYYVRADEKGLGFDRTRSGSGAVDQYHPPLPDRWNSLATCPEEYLLWFHHVPWDHSMKSGKTFWEELVDRYGRGVGEAEAMEKQWQSLKGRVDGELWQAVEDKLRRQVGDARAWSGKCLLYFQTFSKKPLPGKT
ncbi:MAG TPA: alpha-glucuronidase family glycosyl hydrolase [bacterium]|nr:alpha-glucuronidase family glycosyl hydrolase [bacterium]